MEQAIIVDLDGTLCNIEHRRSCVSGTKKDWNGFNGGIPKDTVNEWCKKIIYAFRSHPDVTTKIILLTGRRGTSQVIKDTYKWLEKHSIPHNRLYWRDEDDYRPDHEVKAEIYKYKIQPFFDVIFCIDDRQQVVDMWRRIGLVCLQCDVGDF